MESINVPQARFMVELLGLLEQASVEAGRELAKRVVSRPARVRRGTTLRPGLETRMWNALVEQVRPELNRRGAKAILARELGVHRARIGEFFDSRTAMPDAERVLRLLVWLAKRQNRAVE